MAQPNWSATASPTQLTIAQLFRYGACFEDSETPNARSVTHFYNPQDQGAPSNVAGVSRGPNSLDWMLKPGVGSTLTGQNHFGWADARNAFYAALTTGASTTHARKLKS